MPAVTSQVFSGSHYEIGIQQGRAVSRSIQKALAEIPHFEAVKLMKPRLLPASLFLMLAKRRATKLLTNDVFEHYPKQAQRLKGIVEGAGIDMPTALLLQSMEMLTGKPSFYVGACTSLGFSPQRTSTNETIVAKNFDYPNDFAPYHLTCETRPEEGYKTLGCKMGPQSGILEGINEHGLAVTYNLAYTTETPGNFVPLSIVLQEMLETCKTTDEAARFMTQAKRGGHDALLMLADAEGSLKTVEITSNHAATRDMANEQIINTNHYLTPEMQQYEIPRNAIYSGKVAKEMLGTRVHESSEQRLKRAQELLKGKAKIDENRIITVLRDHGKDNKPSMLTICRHANYASTLRSVIFYPNRKTIKVLYGKPCQNEYTEFKFS